MKTTYQVTEYGSLIAQKKIDGYTTIPESTFEQLENFILSNRNKETDALDLMSLSAKKGIGKTITAKNYVGIIAMKDGTEIEILPKIYSKVCAQTPRIKKLLIDMLKTLKNSPYKSFQSASVDIEKMNVFEVFIRMFIDEVAFIVKRGIKRNYETIESNENVIKGKLLFNEQIKHNCAHKEKAFVEYDEYNTNRPENKLIKSTLLYLYRQTSSVKNKADLRTLLNSFEEVQPSSDYEGDYAKFIPDRNIKDYSTALLWCRVFLMGKSFTSFSGSEIAFALLFPMETLFESYVAVQIKKILGTSAFKVSAQDKTYHLFDFPNKKFLMKPDIVITRKKDSAVFICDTKWKILDDKKSNYGISHVDMYQMYAYQKKYSAQNITLIYPLTEKITDTNIEFFSGDGVKVRVRFVDLFDVKNSLTNIIKDYQLSDL